jgi:hypothetical protein
MAQSPCVKICTIDPSSALCLGCYRTLPEIAQWGSLGDAAHQKILAKIPGRKKSLNASAL